MNSNNPKIEKIEITIGQRLLQGRKILGLSREIVAERLCLKVCTVREIEEDSNPNSVDATFLRGYIRSYAKLVKIPEKEILELLDKYTPAKVAVVSPMQNFSLGKRNKKHEGWLMKCTWLIITICVTMIFVWWWQGYKAQKQEITSMAKQSDCLNATAISAVDHPSFTTDIVVSKQNNAKVSPTKRRMLPTTSAITDSSISQIPNSVSAFEGLKNDRLNSNPIDSAKLKTNPLPRGDMFNSAYLQQNRIETTSINASTIASMESNSRILVDFKGECWLEIRDAKGNILFSGIKNMGQKLELNGESPYEFNIGMPANVNLLFNGDLVDLNRFIKTNRPARFSLPGL